MVDTGRRETASREREGDDSGSAPEVERGAARPLGGYAIKERPEDPLVVDGVLTRDLLVVRGGGRAMGLDVATRELVAQALCSSPPSTSAEL